MIVDGVVNVGTRKRTVYVGFWEQAGSGQNTGTLNWEETQTKKDAGISLLV